MARDLTTQDFGPAMRALTPLMRNFVVCLCNQTSRPNAAKAYRDAGYKTTPGAERVEACRFMHDARVQAAVKEWATAIARTEGMLIATNALLDEAANPQSTQRVKAAEAILNRVGFHATTEQVITVNAIETGDAEMMRRLARVAAKLGKTPEELMGHPVIDVPFEEVSDAATRAAFEALADA